MLCLDGGGSRGDAYGFEFTLCKRPCHFHFNVFQQQCMSAGTKPTNPRRRENLANAPHLLPYPNPPSLWFAPTCLSLVSIFQHIKCLCQCLSPPVLGGAGGGFHDTSH